MASTIKVDNVQNQPGTNIINKCSTTITIGASSDTVTLACGASQTGFGRTGTVDWQTGDIKTAAFIPATGKGYFVNTTGGAVTVNLPAGSAGDIVGLKDYAGTWGTYAVTLNPNGSDNIGGGSSLDPTLTSEGGAVLLVYVDGTQGWLTTAESVTASPTGQEDFIVATGGTPCAGATSGNYKIHTFTGPGTLCVSQIGTTPANNEVSYLIVAGGAGGGSDRAGGGGAGGYRESKSGVDTYTASPIEGSTNVTVTASPYAIVVGGGGSKGIDSARRGGSGNVSSFACISSAGGGGGGGAPACYPGNPGGSGGGGAANSSAGDQPGGTGNTPSTSPAQGKNGGISRYNPGARYRPGGGGGGATVQGIDATCGPYPSGVDGGAGATTCISATPTAYAGGGGAGASACCSGGPGGAGGTGGGGAGGNSPGGGEGTAGGCNTGGGGGGGGNIPNASPYADGGTGGSGVVIIRYKFQ